MSKLRIALAALAIAVAGSANAADLARPYYGNNIQPVQPSVLPGFVWTGAYAGGQIGYAWGKADWAQSPSFSVNGFAGGLHAGYNWQVNQIVYGLEGSINLTGADGDKGCAAGTCSADFNWFGDVRGRLGYAFDRAHVFVGAGVAYADMKVRNDVSSGTAGNFGWTLGVGGEYAVTQNIIAGVEYKYYDFGKDNVTGSISGATLNASVLQARVSYKF
jgi:outer membrane immunogenic protein